MAIEFHVPADLPGSERREILERFERLAGYTDDPIEGVRITLRRPETRAARLRWVADASLVLNGRRLAAHATGSGGAGGERGRGSPQPADAPRSGCTGGAA